MSKLAAALSGQDKRDPTPYEIFRAQVERLRPEIAALCGAENVDKFLRVCLNAVQAKPDVLGADRRSLLLACLRAAQDNLLPDGRDAALNVYKTKVKRDGREEWIEQVQYLPMVYGIVQKIYEAGATYVDAVPVYERDEFDYQRGDAPQISHRPYLGDDDPGKVKAAYVVVKLRSGETKREVMSRRDIERVREKSKQPEGLMWKQFYDQGAVKSVIHRVHKQLPRSEGLERVLASDNAAVGLEAVQPERGGQELEALVDGRLSTELRDQALRSRQPPTDGVTVRSEAKVSDTASAEKPPSGAKAPNGKAPLEEGTAELKAKFVAAIKACKDADVLALKFDEARLYRWDAGDLDAITAAYNERLVALEV